MNDPATNYYGGFNQNDVAELFNALHWNSSTEQHMAVANDLPLAVQDFSMPLFDMILEISMSTEPYSTLTSVAITSNYKTIFNAPSMLRRVLRNY